MLLSLKHLRIIMKSWQKKGNHLRSGNKIEKQPERHTDCFCFFLRFLYYIKKPQNKKGINQHIFSSPSKSLCAQRPCRLPAAFSSLLTSACSSCSSFLKSNLFRQIQDPEFIQIVETCFYHPSTKIPPIQINDSFNC